MAHDRMLRASMRESEKVNGWPIPVRYFWTQLWGYCDSYGRGRRDARLILADTFPLDEEVSAEMVERWMKALETAGVIHSYEVCGKRYFECRNWDEHQDIRYRKRTTIPAPDGGFPHLQESFGKFRKVSPQREGEIEVEVEGGKAKATPQFCPKHPNGTDAPCRACGDARRLAKSLLLAEKSKPTPTPPRDLTIVECAKHKWTADGTCAVCPARREVA